MSNAYERQSQAKQELNSIWRSPESTNIIHYSCESFYERPDGSSPRITSIAVRNLASAQTQSFSIHQIGELRSIPANELTNHYNDLEKEMLDKFFQYAQDKREYKWVHWNMRDENYGFHALELRAKILGVTPAYIIQDDKKFDLARILIGIYGRNYAPNPRLQSLMNLNGISGRTFKAGKDEATLFVNQDYVGLHQSTLAKVKIIADICSFAYEGSLKTAASFWEKNGASFDGLISWLTNQPLILLCSVLVNLLALWNFINGGHK